MNHKLLRLWSAQTQGEVLILSETTIPFKTVYIVAVADIIIVLTLVTCIVSRKVVEAVIKL